MRNYICNRSVLRFLVIGLIGCGGGGGSDSSSGNVAPVITSTAPLKAVEGVKYSYNPVADDPGDTLTWSLTNAPSGMTIDPSTGEIRWTPATGVTTSGAVTLRVTDSGGLTDTEAFTVSVSPAVPIVPVSPPDVLSVRITSIDAANCPATVSVFLNVLDEAGALITDTPATPTFQVTDASVSATVSNVEYKIFDPAVDGPLSVSLVLDDSGSLTPDEISTTQNAAAGFVRALSSTDAAEVIKFQSDAQVMQSYTTDKQALVDGIFANYNMGQTGSYLYAAINKALTDTASRTGRKAIIVVTDGDASDVADASAVIASAVADGIPVYTIGFGQYLNAANLSTLADSTGGIYYELTEAVQSFQSFQSLGQVLNEKWIVTFVPPSPDNSPHDIAVEATTATATGTGLKQNVLICP
jgi:hypothetical protein